MDRGRPKFQSSRNWTKEMPLCRDHHANSNHILFSKNGDCGKKLSRYEFKVKQIKGQSQKVIVNRSKSTDDISSMTHDVSNDVVDDFCMTSTVAWQMTSA
jgi:hypothetical protein